MSVILERVKASSAATDPMPPIDLARVLRDYALEPLRRELRTAGARVLVIEDVRAAREVADAAAGFDAAWVQLEALDRLAPPLLARELVRVLRPGGRLVCVLAGGRPLSSLIVRALRGREEGTGEAQVRDDALEAPVPFSAWRHAFEPAIEWRRSRALGALVPPAAAWPSLPPLALGLLAGVEEVIAGWPLVRALGQWTVHEGVRR